MLRRSSALVFLFVAALLGGCGATFDTTGPLPEGTTLVAESAKALSGLRSVRFTLGVSGTIPGFPVRQITGTATADSAEGHADLQLGTTRIQGDYVLSGDKLTITETDGKRSEMAAPTTLSASVAGLRRLLTSATGLLTEGREKPGDVLSYRVGGTIPRAAISAVIPGIHADVVVKFWVADTPGRQLTRVWIQIPEAVPHEGAVMVELGLAS